MSSDLQPSTVDGVLAEDLVGICGTGAVRPGTDEDRVGVTPAPLVVTPDSVARLSAVVRRIASAGGSLVVAGAGTAMRIGADPSRLDAVVSTLGLDRVLEHSPGDMQVSVEAGVRLSTLQEHLGRHGQRLSLDPEHDGTIGGIIAANGTGPIRHRYGGPRDLLIGVTLVLADGTVARAGGKVVKNVAGYDLCKLMTASYGTLAVIAAATLRLHPVPKARVCLRHRVVGPAAVGAVLRGYAAALVEPTTLELALDLTTGAGAVDALLEGTPDGVAARVSAIQATLGGEPTGAPVAATAEADLVLAVSVKPGAVVDALAELSATPVLRGLAPRVTGRAGLGVLQLELSDVDGAAEPAVDAVRSVAAHHDGAAVVLRAPDAARTALDVWGPVRGLALMRRVKQQFDPRGTLAPGRFVGGI